MYVYVATQPIVPPLKTIKIQFYVESQWLHLIETVEPLGLILGDGSFWICLSPIGGGSVYTIKSEETGVPVMILTKMSGDTMIPKTFCYVCYMLVYSDPYFLCSPAYVL